MALPMSNSQSKDDLLKELFKYNQDYSNIYNNTNAAKYFPNTEEMKKMYEAMQEMIYKQNKTSCRVCGSQDKPSDSFSHTYGCCAQCMAEIFKDFFEGLVKKEIPNSPEYCQECFSHLNACRCPKSEAMRKIKS